MAFNIFTTKRVSCYGQYDRIDDFVPCNLRGDKRPVSRQFLIEEFHFSAVFKCFDPLFVWHFRITSGEVSICQDSTLVGEIADGERKVAFSAGLVMAIRDIPNVRLSD
jgi:hypothetical protein